MRFVIYNGGEKVATVRDAVPAARIAEMFGAGTEVHFQDGYGIQNVNRNVTEIARISVTGQTIDPEHLDREAARLV